MIAWLCALRCEAQPILTRLQARRVPSALGFRIYRKDNAIVAITGVGPERAMYIRVRLSVHLAFAQSCGKLV